MMRLLLWLTDSASFDSRWHCIRQSGWVGWNLMTANALTWLVYWLMCLPLIKIYRAHRETVGAAWLLAASAAFISLCGTHHLLYDLAFYWPAYRVAALNDDLMAAVSVVTCVAFYLTAGTLCVMRPASEVDAERDAKDAALADALAARRELDERNVALVNSVNDLKADLAIYETYYDRDRLHRKVVEAIGSLSDQLPGGPDDGNRGR